MAQKYLLVLLSMVLLVLSGCGKKTEAPAQPIVPPPQPTEVKPAANEIGAFELMTIATTDEARFNTEFVGKVFVIRNLLAYSVSPDNTPPEVITFAYDPANDTIWSTDKARIKGRTIKINATSDNRQIKFVSADDVRKLKDPEIIGSGAQEFDYGEPFSVETRIVEWAGGIVTEAGKLVP